MKYGIKVGQIYVAADGTKSGHIVTDTCSFYEVGDVVTTPFTESGWRQPGNRIDAFKLARVRYSLTPEAPEWMPANKVDCGQ